MNWTKKSASRCCFHDPTGIR